MSKNIRVRFAPSPTGPLHIGGVRTALYNYLFARKHGGTFILRIEDTDRSRFVEGAEEYIMEALEWCGIKVDEGVREGGDYGPYRQSERKNAYEQFAEQLIDSDKAYIAFDTPEDLDNIRKEYEAKGNTFMYNARTRDRLRNSLTLPEYEVSRLIDEKVPYVVRFKMPANDDIPAEDIIRGNMMVNSGTLDDKILIKADGMPTYHLANIVDDHLMEISHVIRGEEWLPSLPLHVMMYEAFGWEAPAFAHLPLLLKPTGKGKLSKRDGDKLGFPVFPLQWPYGEKARGYREDGYFPEAFVNMLALLGWNPGTEKEIFSMDELIEEFSIERVGKSGARFDPEKAKWFNHQYMQMQDPAYLAKNYLKLVKARGYDITPAEAEKLVSMVRERVSFVSELWDQTDFFFEAPDSYNEKAVKKKWKDNSAVLMKELMEVLKGIDPFTSAETENLVKEWIQEKEYGMGAVMNAFRLLVVGALRGPHLFDIVEVLGKEETLERIERGIDELGGVER
ncbi:MAG TPA: glutamate--tRNA ligase [Bacteroidales bacterium]|nr:glutamate--tRNA ligase [Bacteroidales bacterium]